MAVNADVDIEVRYNTTRPKYISYASWQSTCRLSIISDCWSVSFACSPYPGAMWVPTLSIPRFWPRAMLSVPMHRQVYHAECNVTESMAEWGITMLDIVRSRCRISYRFLPCQFRIRAKNMAIFLNHHSNSRIAIGRCDYSSDRAGADKLLASRNRFWMAETSNLRIP